MADAARAVGIALDIWRAGRAAPARIAARQQQRLAELVRDARTRSPYFRALYRDLPPHVTDVRSLPPTSKRELMAHFDDWVTDAEVRRADLDAFIAEPSLIGVPYLGRYFVCTTSGTTGSPVIVLYDGHALTVMSALAAARIGPAWLPARELAAMARGGFRTAGVFATGGHFLGYGMAARRRQSRVRVFSVLMPLDELVRELNAFQPMMLGVYPSALALLAQEQQAGRLHIAPRLIMPAGETLTPAVRQQAAAAFGAIIREDYAASETGLMAHECRAGRLHLSADWTILEAVDEDYQPVPPGETSARTLVTNLANRVQPFLRYELGDRVTFLPDPCPCGGTLPTLRVEGRTDDTLAFPAADGRTVRLLPLALGTVVEETPGVERFQMVQTAAARLSVRLEAKDAADAEQVWAAVERRLQAFLEGQGLAGVEVQRAAEPPQPDPRSGKLRQVWAAPFPGRSL